jgi:DNA polymerase-1
LTPYLKKDQETSKSNHDSDSSKSPNKSEDQFDLLEVEFQMNLQKKNHKYYKTLQDTEHSYQIIQGDLGLKLLLLIKTKSVCFDTGLDALHAELVGISFSYEGKDFTYPFRESG